MPFSSKLLQMGAAGAGEKLYVEDVFSTYLYTGNGSSQTITNNIDLSTEGGLVWAKVRTRGGSGWDHTLVDTVRGQGKAIYSNLTNGQDTGQGDITGFLSNGFTTGSNSNTNHLNETFASWTFRKAEKFFDVVTFTTNSNSGGTFNHSLGSAPGCIIIKRTDGTANWFVWHRGLTSTNYYTKLNGTDAEINNGSSWISSTSTSVTIADNGPLSFSSAHVAYLFAHDAGGFGDAGSDNVISCGSFTGNGSGDATVTLGYEPQWLLYKKTNAAGSWYIADNMRNGLLATGASSYKALYPNNSNAEAGSYTIVPTATGFQMVGGDPDTFIYIAIRRGPMKTPTTGTSVFTPSTRAGTGASVTTSNLSFPPDAVWSKGRDNGGTNSGAFDRLRGATLQLSLNQADAETTASTSLTGFDVMTGYTAGADAVQLTINATGYNYVNWQFRRAPGFFDVVATSVFSTGTNVNHNLGVTPELVIAKARNTSGANWMGAFKDGTSVKNISLNVTTAAYNPSLTWSDYFTSTTFNPTAVKNAAGGGAYGTSSPTVIYLFASLSGVSKIGTYTGNGSSVTVTTNFQPRFILVKRTDSTGNWIVGDSARGLVSADEPALFLNTTAAETTGQDWVDVSSTGFTVNETALNANVNNATYIYLAIA